MILDSNNLKEAALKYLEIGFSIIPANGKKALISWEKYQSQKPTKDEVEEWWSKYPNANIAVVTGAISNLVVIDVDGVKVTNGMTLTPTSQSSPGRYHYYYQHPGFEVPNSASVIAQGIDVRGDGGLIILPPSQHFDKVTGQPDHKYTWLVSPEEEPFAPLPDWILEIVKVKKTIEVIAHGSTQGTRNNDAAAMTGSLLARYPQPEWGSICWDLLKGWNTQNSPMLPESELRTVFDSICQRELAKKPTKTQTQPKVDEEALSIPVTLEEALRTVDEILPGKKDLVRLAMATSISHLLDQKTPLWIMFVGVPSSAKTEVARLLNYIPSTYYLDALTENAFVSGAKNHNGSEPLDLLPLLNGKCFIIKDFTTTLSQREETVKKILGDLTSIYDDSFGKHSGARGTVRYHAFFSILGCVTPQAINRHQRYMNQIGPRFLFFRVPTSEETEVNQALEIIWSFSDSKAKFTEAQKKVSAYCYQLAQKVPEIQLNKESKEVQDQLNSLAKFIARARGMVITKQAEFYNSDNEKVTFYEPLEVQIEEPFRALLQLRVLARSLAVVSGKQEVGVEELELVKKVALSSMPADRALLLSVIATEDKQWSAKEIADQLGISHKTALRQMDELVSLKVLSKTEQGNGLANLYSIHPSLRSVVYTTEEFMSSSEETETQTPHPDNNAEEAGPKVVISQLPGLEGYGKRYY